eukprot:c26076_g1_i1 orf=617-1606(-)
MAAAMSAVLFPPPPYSMPFSRHLRSVSSDGLFPCQIVWSSVVPPVPLLRSVPFSRSLKVHAGQMGTSMKSFEESQECLTALIKQVPELQFKAAKKLRELTDDLAREEKVDEATAAMTQLHPLEKIKHGFARFKNEDFLKRPHHYEKLKSGQSPKLMVIACSDSRVCPTHILGLQPGEAFIVRNVANLIPPWNERGFPGTSAAVEYAVLHLKVEHILVIGHSLCGGIRALMSMPQDGKKTSDFIEDWIQIGKPASAHVKDNYGFCSFDEQCRHCEKESVNVSLKNLLAFPWVKELVSQNKLALHGGYYDFLDGSFQHWPSSVKVESEVIF